MSGNPQTQWNINLGQAFIEELRRERELSLCKMCHKNPAEYSGYCGDCYNKLESDKKTKKVTKHWRPVFPILHLFDT